MQMGTSIVTHNVSNKKVQKGVGGSIQLIYPNLFP